MPLVQSYLLLPYLSKYLVPFFLKLADLHLQLLHTFAGFFFKLPLLLSANLLELLLFVFELLRCLLKGFDLFFVLQFPLLELALCYDKEAIVIIRTVR